ncbi:MAG: hypothetical protein ACHWZW_09940 [Spirulina sp.]
MPQGISWNNLPRCVVLGLAVMGTAGLPAAAQTTGPTLVNRTTKTLVGLYVVPAGSGTFGQNRLASSGVGPNQTVPLNRSSDHCIYDILSLFSDGDRLADYGVDLCSAGSGLYSLYNAGETSGKLSVFNGTNLPITGILIEGATVGVQSQPSPSAEPELSPEDCVNLLPDLQALHQCLEERVTLPQESQGSSASGESTVSIQSTNSSSSSGSSSGGTSSVNFNRSSSNDGSSRVSGTLTTETGSAQQEQVSNTESCVNGVCTSTFSGQVSLLGSASIQPQQETQILASAADLRCTTIQRYDVTVTYRNGRQEKLQDVNLCDGQARIVVGEPPQQAPILVTVQNATDQALVGKNLVLREFYAVPAGGRFWQYNLLAGRIIQPGAVDQVAVPATANACLYDLRAVFVNPERVEHLDPVDWLGVNLCDPRQQTLVYGLPATSGVEPSVNPASTGLRLLDMAAPGDLGAAEDPVRAWMRTKGTDLKQLVASNVNSCVSPQNSRMCQPPRQTRPPSRPWWQVWRRP